MSHTTVCKQTPIRDMAAAAAAAIRCGGTLIVDKKRAKTFNGREINCDHVISHPNAVYEIGLRQSKDEPGTYDLVFDDWRTGKLDNNFSTKAGGQMDKLRMFYDLESDRNYAKSKGYIFTEVKMSETQYMGEMITPDATNEVAMSA